MSAQNFPIYFNNYGFWSTIYSLIQIPIQTDQSSDPDEQICLSVAGNLAQGFVTLTTVRNSHQLLSAGRLVEASLQKKPLKVIPKSWKGREKDSNNLTVNRRNMTAGDDLNSYNRWQGERKCDKFICAGVCLLSCFSTNTHQKLR